LNPYSSLVAEGAVCLFQILGDELWLQQWLERKNERNHSESQLEAVCRWSTGPTFADAGPNPRRNAGPLWTLILWRHRVQSNVLRSW